ncbi:DUF3958 family protein [Enterococcus sp. AZ109]|uniref:DUF3958 family protein n=1 Tax=Enterococcus sp. AZ109 TaxID=2774634 RepID=UPI003F26B569
MIIEDKLTNIRKKEGQLHDKRNELYLEQREFQRMHEATETHLSQSQKLFHEVRTMSQKNENRHLFGDLYSDFSKDAGAAMIAFFEKQRELKRQEQQIAEKQEELLRQKRNIHTEEERKDEH